MAERLWSSLDPPVDEAIAASQLQEVEERLDAYERGEVGAVPADEAIEMALKAAKKRAR
jgi:putative addiction module component (TIGR02574 family)